MERINNIGKTLLGYKSELLKHYSPIVDESLIIALETQMDKKILKKEDYDLIINDDISVDFFEKHLLNKKEYIKTTKELFIEFEKIREIVNECLINLEFVDFIETESNIDINKISILRQYTLTNEFIKVFFGLDEKELEPIMRKKGFAEKFAVLRLTKVFKEIYSEMRSDNDYTYSFSKVYYNDEYNGFSIDFKYHINIDNIHKENIEDIIKKIKETDKYTERKFLKKTSMQFYNIKPVEPLSRSLNLPKYTPTNKSKETEINENEMSEIKEQITEDLKNDENILKEYNNNETLDNIKTLDNPKENIEENIEEITNEDFFEVATNLIKRDSIDNNDEKNLDNDLEEDFEIEIPEILDDSEEDI